MQEIRVIFRSAKDVKNATFAERKATVKTCTMLTCSDNPKGYFGFAFVADFEVREAATS